MLYPQHCLHLNSLKQTLGAIMYLDCQGNQKGTEEQSQEGQVKSVLMSWSPLQAAGLCLEGGPLENLESNSDVPQEAPFLIAAVPMGPRPLGKEFSCNPDGSSLLVSMHDIR